MFDVVQSPFLFCLFFFFVFVSLSFRFPLPLTESWLPNRAPMERALHQSLSGHKGIRRREKPSPLPTPMHFLSSSSPSATFEKEIGNEFWYIFFLSLSSLFSYSSFPPPPSFPPLLLLLLPLFTISLWDFGIRARRGGRNDIWERLHLSFPPAVGVMIKSLARTSEKKEEEQTTTKRKKNNKIYRSSLFAIKRNNPLAYSSCRNDDIKSFVTQKRKNQIDRL